MIVYCDHEIYADSEGWKIRGFPEVFKNSWDATAQIDELNKLRKAELRAQRPEHATHYSETYGGIDWYCRIVYNHLNQVCEEWQKLTKWKWWDRGKWHDVGSGFSSRRLKDVAELFSAPKAPGNEKSDPKI